jgi:hypothetical protein
MRPAGCLPCCSAAPVVECYLTLPTLLVDGNSTPFTNSTEAQNFFDNSGALLGCRSDFPGEEACNCLVELQTNVGAGVGFTASVNDFGPNYLDIISAVNPNGTTPASLSFLWKFTAASAMSLNNINVSLFDQAFGFLTSNVIANATVVSTDAWEAWQNISINTAGDYCVFTNYGVTPTANSSQTGLRSNAIGSVDYNVCSLRASYGNVPDYIYCQSGSGPPPPP